LQQQALLSSVGEVEFYAESYCCLADAYLAQDPYSTAKPLKLLGNALSSLNKQEEEWPNFRYNISLFTFLFYCLFVFKGLKFWLPNQQFF
jgi:hypothetical protein